MSQGILAGLLKVIHHLHDNGNLVVGASGTKGMCACFAARYANSNDARAPTEMFRLIKIYTSLETTNLSQAELRQTREFVRVWKTNAVEAIQALMLDEQFPPGSLYLQRRGDTGNE